MEEDHSQDTKRWLEDLSNGRLSKEGIERLALQGLRVVRVEPGFVLCNFLVPSSLTDKDGNWHVAAMATLIDNIAGAAVMSSMGFLRASLDFSISYFSTVKINEEVEIEGKILVHKGKLSSVMVEIRRKDSGEKIALGKQWMASITSKWHNGQRIDLRKQWMASTNSKSHTSRSTSSKL